MTTQQRYTGPELSALLREVRAELGDQAIIHEANRIRTGGIGGFFRKEGFEVLASPPSGGVPASSTPSRTKAGRRFGLNRSDVPATPASAGQLSVGNDLAADEELIAKLTAAMESEQAWVDAIGPSASPPPPTIEKRPVRRFGPEDLAPIEDDFDRISSSSVMAQQPVLASSLANGSPPEPRLTPGQALLERADTISSQERVGQLLSGAQSLIDDTTIAERTRVVGRAVPPRGLMDDPSAADRFPGLLHRLENRVNEPVLRPPSVAPEPARLDRARSTSIDSLDAGAPIVDTPPRTPTARTATPPSAASPTTISPVDARRSGESAAESTVVSTTVHQGEAERQQFWDDLTRLESILPIRPTTQASVQLLVGPLDIALPLATRFTNDATIGLAIFCDEVELTGIRSDQLADSSRDLHHRLLERSRTGTRAVGVIEADDARRERDESLDCMLTPRVLTMIDRVCADGAVDLLRLTLRSLGPIDELRELVDSFAVPCAIDLHATPTSEELVASLDAQLPIVSIAGRQLTPALAMALKKL